MQDQHNIKYLCILSYIEDKIFIWAIEYAYAWSLLLNFVFPYIILFYYSKIKGSILVIS